MVAELCGTGTPWGVPTPPASKGCFSVGGARPQTHTVPPFPPVTYQIRAHAARAGTGMSLPAPGGAVQPLVASGHLPVPKPPPQPAPWRGVPRPPRSSPLTPGCGIQRNALVRPCCPGWVPAPTPMHPRRVAGCRAAAHPRGAAVPRPARGPSAWRGAHGARLRAGLFLSCPRRGRGWPWGQAGMAERTSPGTGTPALAPSQGFPQGYAARGGRGGHRVLWPLWILGTPPGLRGSREPLFLALVSCWCSRCCPVPASAACSTPAAPGQLQLPQEPPGIPLPASGAARSSPKHPDPACTPPGAGPREPAPEGSHGLGSQQRPGEGAGCRGRCFSCCWLRHHEMPVLLQTKTSKQNVSPGNPPPPLHRGLGRRWQDGGV